MRKIENIIKFSVGLVCIASIVAIVSNFILVPQIKTYYESNRSIVDEISVLHAETRLPIAVLGNIKTQVQKDKSAKMNDALKNAYAKNKLIIQVNIKKFNKLYGELGDNLTKIDKQTLGRHSNNLAPMKSTVDELSSKVSDINSTVSVAYIVDTDVEKLAKLFIEQDESIKSLIEYQKNIENSMINDITFIINAVIIILISILFLLGVVILRFIQFDFSYLMKNLKIISSRKNFDASPSKLKPYFDEEIQMVKYVESIIAEKSFSDEITTLLTKYYIVDDVVDALFYKLGESLDIDRIGVAFVDYEGGKIIAEHGVIKSGEIKLGPGFEVSIESTRLKKIIDSGEPMIIDDLEAEHENRPYSPSLELIRREGMLSNMIIPLMVSGSVFGMVFFSSRKKAFFNSETLRIGKGIINEIETLMNRAYFTKVVFSKMTSSFAELVEGKDTSTGEHIQRMVKYSVILAKGLKAQNIPGYDISEKYILEIERNAASHDIGKVSIPDAILKKPGPLTPEEWQEMRTHAAVGADIFREIRESLKMFDKDFFKVAEEIARYHHEKWNGSGYPEGLKGDEIPLSARIVAIADVFDALTSKRVYKDAHGFNDAVETIKKGAGKHFDPNLVEVFLNELGAIRRIYEL